MDRPLWSRIITPIPNIPFLQAASTLNLRLSVHRVSNRLMVTTVVSISGQGGLTVEKITQSLNGDISHVSYHPPKISYPSQIIRIQEVLTNLCQNVERGELVMGSPTNINLSRLPNCFHQGAIKQEMHIRLSVLLAPGTKEFLKALKMF